MSPAPHIDQDQGFVEVADRCWVARHAWFDVNVSVVAGERGLLVVDTHASAAEARRVVEEIRRLDRGDVVAVVNTHEHFDHVFGNGVLQQAYPGIPVHAHEVAAARTVEAGEAIKRRVRGSGHEPDAREQGLLATDVVAADRTFSSVSVVDLGDRMVELIHPGRGHTGGDILARVPDVDVVLAGDLVEESAERSAVPGFGDDCYPLEWPATLDLVASMLTPATVVVPGHGQPVDREFVLDQRSSIGIVAETIRDLAGRGVKPEEMAEAGEWPYPVEELEHAFRRGVEMLPRSARSLPLA
jgi:glyoxylase-like metal-dependent hydrolase (beta-lactamase superfamily II)